MLGVQGQPELHSIRCQDYIAKDTITEKRGRRDIHKQALQVVSVEADVTEANFRMSLLIELLCHGPSEQTPTFKL